MPLPRQEATARAQQALTHFQAGRLHEAEMVCRDILLVAPHHVDSLHLLGLIAHQTGHNDQAAGLFTQAIKQAPAIAELHWNLGSVLRTAGRTDDALASFRKALRLKPDSVDMHRKLGDVLRDLGRPEEALGRYQKAIQLKPQDAEAHHNLALAHKTLGRTKIALEGFYESVRLAPNHPQAHYNLGIMLLLAGRLEEGWREYEWRWRMPTFKRRDCVQPVWGGEPLQGRTLLIHAEQGFGDTIQFCRFVPPLARDNDIILQVPQPVMRLLSRPENMGRLIPPGKETPPFDLYCSLMSLPALLDISSADLPAATPYLAADPAEVARWRQRLAGYAGLHVGLAWAGSVACAADEQRSMTLDQLAGLAGLPAVTFVSLQKGRDGASDGAPMPGMLDWTEELDDFADTAGLIGALDLVISVDTAVVHLAGALGKPVWLLNRFDPCWRWQLEREDSPWYPTLRQFRQSRMGDWDDVIGRVRTALAALTNVKPPGLTHVQ